MTDNNKVLPARPDWRDPEQYRHLLDLDRAGWAWEWLRRNPEYVDEARDKPAVDIDVVGASRMTILRCSALLRGGPWGLSFRGRGRSLRSFCQVALESSF